MEEIKKNILLRYAAIDIGSNAVRLLLCNAVEEHGETHFKKGELIRIPLRLGETGRVGHQRDVHHPGAAEQADALVDPDVFVVVGR